jgi:hypothetical protein
MASLVMSVWRVSSVAASTSDVIFIFQISFRKSIYLRRGYLLGLQFFFLPLSARRSRRSILTNAIHFFLISCLRLSFAGM